MIWDDRTTEHLICAVWSRVCLELVKKLSAFDGTRSFITALTPCPTPVSILMYCTVCEMLAQSFQSLFCEVVALNVWGTCVLT